MRKDELNQAWTGLKIEFLEGYGAPTVKVVVDGISTLWQARVDTNKRPPGPDTWWKWEQL